MTDVRDELIRIDQHGVAHPIGSVASQRMRPHQGTYRLLPGPPHVVFMRYTGEDGRVDEGDGSLVRLAGEITAPGTICDIFALLGQTGWRGLLSVHQGGITRQIYIDQGNALGVKSNEPHERLGQVLYRYGHVSEDELLQIEQHVGEGRRFGEIALDMGFVSKEVIYQAFRQQVTDVVVGAMHVSDGTYFFLDGFAETELSIRQAVSINSLLMDGVTRMDELRYFEEKIPTAEHVPSRVPNEAAPAEEYLTVYEHVEGEKSVREIGRITGLGEFATTKVLYGLIQSKHIAIRPPSMKGGPVAIVSAANDVMGAVFRRAQEAGVEAELMAGLQQFTVGAGVFYDMLFQGAGPDAHGKLDAERVAANAPMVAQGDDIEQSLRKLLFDYVSFALFSVGSTIGKESERALQEEVDPALSALRPNG